MNANQLINMLVRMGTRLLMRKGINAGVKAASGAMARRKGDEGSDAPQVDEKETAKRIKQTMKIGRRVSRF